MTVAIAMPKLGMTMEEGIVVEWRVPLGGAVAKGQVLLVIESEKSEVEIESPASGYLRHVYVEPGRTVACGTLLAALTESADAPFDAEHFQRDNDRPIAPVSSTAARSSAPAGANAVADRSGGPPGAPSPAARSSASSGATSAGTAGASSGAAPSVARPVTPAARRLAHELDIDATAVSGSGPGGRVTREDVEQYAQRLASRVTVAEGVALDVTVAGRGTPVLLLPGFGIDVSAFAPQIKALSSRCQTIAVNPRGVGFSDAPDVECYDVATSAADAAAAADAVAGAPCCVVGASLGAAVAIELALARPDLVRSLVLITPFLEASVRLTVVTEAWCRLAAEASGEGLARALLPWMFSESYLGDRSRRRRAVSALVQTAARVPASILIRYAAAIAAWSGTRRDDLRRIEVPTLVVAAGDDLLTPDAADVAGAIPHADLLRVPSAGHAVTIEAPEAVSEAILAHCERATAAPRA